MKRIILVLMSIIPYVCYSQEYRLHVEVKDTFEVAYHEYFSSWVQITDDLPF